MSKKIICKLIGHKTPHGWRNGWPICSRCYSDAAASSQEWDDAWFYPPYFAWRAVTVFWRMLRSNPPAH